MALPVSKADEALVRLAMGKEWAGEVLTGEESRALRRWEKAEWEKTCWKVYGSVPKKHYRELSGRQDKVINQQADRYGLSALLGPTVDLGKLLRQFHDFLAKHWLRFEQDIEAAEILTGGNATSPAMERYRGYKADLAALEVEAKQGELLPRSDCRVAMLTVAGIIRTAGEHLDREFGPGAREILEAALDDCVVKIEEMFPGSEAVAAANEG